MTIDSHLTVEPTLGHRLEVSSGERFEFGKNWASFLKLLDDDRIRTAEESLKEMLEYDTLFGKRFIDIGSGSGLFSLAARQLGATVVSFDYDPDSFSCTSELKRRYFPGDDQWVIKQGSVLDKEFLETLGDFDIVYSWGVLHHTGAMWQAIENAASLVRAKGKLFIAIYNDTGSQAARWRWIKRTYCKLPRLLKNPFALLTILPEETKRLASFILKGKPIGFIQYWSSYKNTRGMSRWHDIVDWVGGYPYEFAGPSALFEFVKRDGFRLSKMKCDNVGLGCNEIVFVRD